MPVEWVSGPDATGGVVPSGRPSVDLDRLQRLLESLPAIDEKPYFDGDDDDPKRALDHIQKGVGNAADFRIAALYALADRKDKSMLMSLARRSAEEGTLWACAEWLADAITIGPIFEKKIADENMFLDLQEVAALHATNGRDSRIPTAEAAFALGAYHYEKRRYGEAIYFWERSADLGIWEGACGVGLCLADRMRGPEDALAAARWFMKLKKTEQRDFRFFDELWIPVVPEEGWVRNPELLADLANNVRASDVDKLNSIVEGALDRLLWKTPELGFLAKSA